MADPTTPHDDDVSPVAEPTDPSVAIVKLRRSVDRQIHAFDERVKRIEAKANRLDGDGQRTDTRVSELHDEIVKMQRAVERIHESVERMWSFLASTGLVAGDAGEPRDEPLS